MKRVVVGIIKIVVIIVAVIIGIALLPVLLLVKLIDIIFQPYLHKKATNRWNNAYQEELKRGVYIDYPPEYGGASILYWLKRYLHPLNETDD